MPLVSVVVPTFNRAYCLAQALESALAQSHRDLELVVVDDGSIDATPDLLAAFAERDPRVRLARQPNLGVAAARNHGLRLARGAYIALLDSDDVWVPWKLEAQLAVLEGLPEAGMVWTDLTAVDPVGRVVCSRYLRVMYSAYRFYPRPEDLFESSMPIRLFSPELAAIVGDSRVFAGDIYSPMILGNLVHTSTVVLRRERLERAGGFDESLQYAGEDYDFHLRTCREGPVAYLDLSTTQYQLGLPDRLTRPEYALHMARNFLATVHSALRRDQDRIRTPPGWVRQTLAEGHAWAGQAALTLDDRLGGRHHLLESLREWPWQPRVAALLAVVYLPGAWSGRLRRAFRHTRRVLRPPQ
jgi:glycosyltransferase involved in cell wall biosynthesis